jgi:hypothetical protein
VRAAIRGAIKDSQPEIEAAMAAAGAATVNDAFGTGGSVADILRVLGGHGFGSFLGGAGSLFNDVTGVVEKVPVVGGVIGDVMNPLHELEKAGGRLAIPYAVGYALGYTVWQAFQPMLLPINHAIASVFQNQIFDMQTAAELVTKRVISQRDGADEAHGNAFDNWHFDGLLQATYNWPAISELMELHRRGEITDHDLDNGIQRNGIPPEFADKIKGLQRIILSPADLALAHLRGDITPEELAAYTKMVGVTTHDMDTLIGNTGEPPGLMQLLEAYRRHFIDKDRLEKGVRQSRVRNEWIPTIEKLRYTPMSTADAVRATVENYMQPSEARDIADANGLEPGHIDFLLQAWGRPLAHGEMMALYHRGLATIAQVKQSVRESDIKDKYVNMSVELGRRLLSERLIVQAIHYNAIDLATGARKLQELGYNAQDAGILIKLGVHEAQGAHKELTRAQIVQLYNDNVLSQAQAEQHLTNIGYSAANAGYALRIADVQQHTKEINAEKGAIRASFLAGNIDSVQAQAQLQGIGLSLDQAQHSVTVWSREKHRASRVLSEAQIVKAAEQGVVTPAEALTLLEASGFSRADATILLKSHGIT